MEINKGAISLLLGIINSYDDPVDKANMLNLLKREIAEKIYDLLMEDTDVKEILVVLKIYEEVKLNLKYAYERSYYENKRSSGSKGNRNQGKQTIGSG